MDKKILTFILLEYTPQTAAFQRMWALIKGLLEQGVQVNLYFIFHNDKNKITFKHPNLKCVDINETSKIHNVYICFIYSMLKILINMKKNDNILITSWIPVLLFLLLFNHKKVNFYIEYNEYPPLILGDGILGKIKEKILNMFIRKTEGIFVISNKIKEYFLSQGIRSNQIEVLNMIVDNNRFTNVIPNESSNYISYCGTISEYKDGVDILIRSFSKLHEQYPEYKLRIIGRFHNNSVENNLKNILRTLGISDSVIFTGEVPYYNMPRLLSDSKLLVLARPDNVQSRYGFPTKLGEYLLSGVPVVVTKVGEIDCFLKDKESVIFAEPNSVDDFYLKMKWVLDNYDRIKHIPINGKKIALKNFNYLIESRKIINKLSF